MNTKEKLFNSMYELIAEVGYDKASINQICINAGIKKSSFYYFYESKENLFKELIKTGYNDELFIEIKKILNSTSKNEYKNMLFNLSNILVNNYETDLKWKRVIAEVELQALRNEEIKLLVDNYYKDFKNELKNIFNHGVALKVFNENFDVELNVNILCVLIQGIDNAMISGMKLNEEKIFREVIERMFI